MSIALCLSRLNPLFDAGKSAESTDFRSLKISSFGALASNEVLHTWQTGLKFLYSKIERPIMVTI